MTPFDFYLQNNQDFIADLEARESDEVKYDSVILGELRKGKKFKQAFNAGKNKYPEEAWAPRNTEEFDQLEAHYDYLLEHENIIKKLKKL